MSIPTDPYNGPSRRPFDDGDILAPIEDKEALEPADDVAQEDAPAGSEAEELLLEDLAISDEDAADITDEAAEELASLLSEEDLAAAEEALKLSDDGDMTTPLDTPSEDAPTASNAPSATTASAAGVSDAPADHASEAPTAIVTPGEDFDLDGRTALAAAVGLGGATLPEEPEAPAQAEPTKGFMPTESEADAEQRRERWASTPAQVLLDEVPDEPRGRGWTHALTLVATLLLVPVAWYLFFDGHTRLMTAMSDGTRNFAGAGELAAGLAVAALIWILARSSSLGVTVTGILVTVFGALGLAIPRWTTESILSPIVDALAEKNDFFFNVAHHLTYTTLTGLMFGFGVVLILTGYVSHAARRRGQVFGVLTTRRALAKEATASELATESAPAEVAD